MGTCNGLGLSSARSLFSPSPCPRRHSYPTMRKISSARTSRRAPGLKDSDYDHEIALVDHAAEAATPQRSSPEPSAQPDETGHALSASQTPDTDQALSKYTTAAASSPSLTQPGPSSLRKDQSGSRSNASASSASTSLKSKASKSSLKKSYIRRKSKEGADIPRVEVEGEEPLSPFPCNRTCVSDAEKNLRP